MMKSGCVAVLCLTILYFTGVPSAHALSLSSLEGMYGEFTDLDRIPESTDVEKRNKGVDAWSICPPQMTDVDCFYAYLRVYARLRKAAEESDRVSMRNIGKRSSLTSLPAETERPRSRLRRLPLCSDDVPPSVCYLSVLMLYQRMQSDMDTRH
ncbi:hypothetical protein ACOMHN_016112 [Nucella lapillus]